MRSNNFRAGLDVTNLISKLSSKNTGKSLLVSKIFRCDHISSNHERSNYCINNILNDEAQITNVEKLKVQKLLLLEQWAGVPKLHGDAAHCTIDLLST